MDAVIETLKPCNYSCNCSKALPAAQAAQLLLK